MSDSARTLLLCAVLGMSLTWGQTPDEDPVDSGIVEQAERRLVQVDVSVRGPADTLAALTESDFRVRVGGRTIESFVLDRVCIDGEVPSLDPSEEPIDPEVAKAAPTLRTLLFFDQTHLTRTGRRRTVDLARGLVDELLSSPRAELMIVSASRRLHVTEWNRDRETLLAALDEIERDPEQMPVWAEQEDIRVDRMMTAIDRMAELIQAEVWDYNRRRRQARQAAANGFSPPPTKTDEEYRLEQQAARRGARIVARELVREETARTAAGLDLFSVALQYLDDHAPPKAVVYFADTMRANPGDFYVDLVRAADRSGGRVENQEDYGLEIPLFSDNYVTEFQRVIDLATEKGVRLYTVQGRGLAPKPLARGRITTSALTTLNPLVGRSRFDDAENSLVGLARETGGKSFLGAADASQIAGRIFEDLSCLFVLSFHAPDLKEDRRTPVRIGVERAGVELQYRPRVIALSQAEREKARLASAFWKGNRSRERARLVALPTGFRSGRYTVLFQFAIPGSPLGRSDWDMGVTVVHGKNRARDAAGRVSVNQAGLPLVFEAQLQLPPGEFTVTAVARHTGHGEIVSTKLEGSLPDPDEEEPFVASIVLLQRAAGAFVRGDATKTAGSLAHDDTHWLRPDRPVGILALVCGHKRAEPVTAARTLEGASEVSWDAVELDFSQERCGLLLDSIDADVMTSGRFSYTVDLTRGTDSIAATAHEFLVVTDEEIALARQEADAP